MAMEFECRDHGVALAGTPGFEKDSGYERWIDDMIAEHEQQHARELLEATSTKWRVHRDDDGWWVARRHGQNGLEEVACLTWQQAHRIVAGVTLKELAGDAWTVRIFDDRVTLQEHGDPFMKQFPGPTAIDQALGFLRSIIADRARRLELAELRDKARAELDALDEHLQHAAARERAAS